MRSGQILRWVGRTFAVLAVSASANAAVFDFTVPNAGNRSLRLNVPGGVSVVKAIIIHGNGAGSDDRGMAVDPELVALGESLGFAVMGTAYWTNFPPGYVPSELSGFEAGLQQLAAMSGHPEIVRAPWLPIGHSNGGNMSWGLNALRPEKIIAMVVSKGGYPNNAPYVARPDPAALATPGLLVAGEIDLDYRLAAIRDEFFGNRPRGALWAWVEEEGMTHSIGDSQELTLPFVEAMAWTRYPATGSPLSGSVTLRPVDERDGWLTDPESYKEGFANIAPYTAYTKDKSVAGWLPNRRLAYIFRAFASYNKATPTATLSTGAGPVDLDTRITYTVGEPTVPWTRIEFYEGGELLKSVAPAGGAQLTVQNTPAKPGYSVYHAIVTCVDGTQKTTMPRRVLVRAGPAPAIRAITGPATASLGGSVTFRVTAEGNAPLAYQWRRNGADLLGATSASYEVVNLQPADAGLYTVVVTNTAGTAESAGAILAPTPTAKVTGGLEIPDLRHPNGRIYDQVLLTSPAATITADAGQVTRLSYIDLSDDIVQVEFSGSGALTLTLDDATGPALPLKYNQAVSYMKGHATITIAGAAADTHVSIFTVGTLTAVDQSLFRVGADYDGVADVALLSISSADGRFGGVRTANAEFWNFRGLTGIYAPGVQFTGPVYLHNVSATDAATPVLLSGPVETGQIGVTGGNLHQPNGCAIQISDVRQIAMIAGTTSHNVTQPPRTNAGRCMRRGEDVTAEVVLNPRD